MRDVIGAIRAKLMWPLLYLLVAVAALGANPFRGETVGPFDLLVSYQGWNPDSKEVVIRNTEKSDILDYFLPTWIDARERIRDGDMPLWDALRAGGSPALLDPTNAILTPGFALFAAAPDPTLGYYLAALSTLLLAGFGMHLLVRRYYGDGIAFFCGISFMMCGFLAAFVYMPHAQTAIWIPWLLWAVDRFFDRGNRAALLPIAAVTGLCFLGGFPFVVALALGAALVFAVLRSLALDRRAAARNIGSVVLGLVLGLGIVALPLLTLADTLDATNLGYRDAGSELNWKTDLPILLRPWTNQTGVSTTLYAGAVVMVALLIGIACLCFMRRRVRANALAWSGLVYVVVGVVLTFEILPVDIGRHLPVLSNNPWTRCLLLMGIGFILVAAHGLQPFLRLFRPKWAQWCVLVLLCIIQAADLGRQFRRFNGPVPSDLFYPVSPQLAELKKRIHPFQYVAQDSPSFIMSGTLGAVGLPEWYAHSLRSTQLATLLDAMALEPFQSPTSTAIRLHQYHWRNPVLDAVGLCYGVSARPTEGWGTVTSAAGSRAEVLPPIGSRMLVQPFSIESAMAVVALDVRLATYGAKALDGNVIMEVRSSDAGGLLETISMPASALVDNRAAAFLPRKPLPLEPGDYIFTLRYEAGPLNKPLTAWYFTDGEGALKLGNREIAGSLDFGIYKKVDDGLVQVGSSPDVSIFQNPDCADGPYFSRNVALTRVDAGRADVKLIDYSPDRFSIRSNSRESGFVIVPMQYRHGWSATVDGVSVEIDKVIGLLPAIPVPRGNVLVAMVYRPPAFWPGLMVTLLSLFVLAASTRLRVGRVGGGG